MPDSAPLDDQSLINREFSLLEFNGRVQAQALNSELPLLERLRFLCIASTNMDEFFEIRVSGLQQRCAISPGATDPDGRSAAEVLASVLERARRVVERQYQIWNQDLIPAMQAAGVRFVPRETWSDELRADMHRLFREEIVPVLTPLTLDPSRPFPRILNKSLNFIAGLKGKDVFGRRRHRGLVQAPRSLPRLFRLDDASDGSERYVSLSAVMQEFVDELFPGLSVTGCYQFRVTRNTDLFVDEEEVDDLARVLEGELAASRYGDVVRLEVSSECTDELAQYLLDYFKLDPAHLFRVDGPVNLNRLLAICDDTSRNDLLFQGYTPGTPDALMAYENTFDALAAKDVLIHHPFQSFSPVIELLAQAAGDPHVLAIKQTLYRTGPDSPIVRHLIDAAYAGKEVTVVIELMARSDEAQNIELANRLQEAGAHVVYGVIGFKTHAKLMLIVRREADGLRRYVHLGTGNYHPKTARLYTDYGLLSANDELGRDVHELFMQMTSLTASGDLKHIITSPFQLHGQIVEWIEREAENAQAGKPARIVAKLNALIEPKVIDALYRASNAGVQIDLIVRGICSLRPGVPGLSENISVRSIIGRFLEHSRVYCFHNNGREKIYCASADWMDRNFFRRIEVCFPVLRKSHRQRIRDELELYLADNTQAWLLQPDGSYRPIERPAGLERICAQSTLIGRYAV
ncbi:MAG: polyphosphate kinase 1 [Pseudomonadota bacterium]